MDPFTCNLNPFAVVPTPTPVESTANSEEPAPTASFKVPGVVVAIPRQLVSDNVVELIMDCIQFYSGYKYFSILRH